MSKIYVTGLGPGAADQMTIQAKKVLEKCPVIIGYTVYIDLIRDEYPDKIFLSTPMRKEADRCRMAFAEAEKGQDVAMVCSGDAGIYGHGRSDLRDRKGLSRCGNRGRAGDHGGVRRRGSPRGAADARFCSDQPERPAHFRGRRSRSVSGRRRKRILSSAFIIRPAKSGRTICRKPAG